MDQQFSLRWNNYLNQITDAFGSLRSEADLVDVTLSCEGKKIKAHKMLLSACSTYFRDIFKENPCQHPVIVFRNVKYEDLEAIVDFMYKGEVNVIQDQLESFLGTAELLQVKGLTEDSGKDVNFEEEENNAVLKSKQEISPEFRQDKPVPQRSQPPVSFIPVSTRPASPPTKKRKYNTPSNHGKPPERKLRSPVNEISSLPVVPKEEKQDYIEDLTYDEEEENVDLAEPTVVEQMAPRNLKSVLTMEFNTNSNSSQDQLDNSSHSMGQMLLAEPGTSLESVPQESVQGVCGIEKFAHVCQQCGAKYEHKSTLVSHLKTHTGETQCHVCHKVLSSVIAHKRHLALIHNIIR